MNNKSADQTARMRRLICAFAYGINRFPYDEAQIIDRLSFYGPLRSRIFIFPKESFGTLINGNDKRDII